METFTRMFYTIEEAAELLQVHKNTLYNQIRAGKIDHYRVGNQIRITARELEKKLRVPAEDPEPVDTSLSFRTVDNAKRLASVLDQSADPRTLQHLAELLRYYPSQLETDIHDLAAVVGAVKKPED